MVPERFRLSWVLAATLAVYLLTLGVMLRWHWALGPPHTQASLWSDDFVRALCGASGAFLDSRRPGGLALDSTGFGAGGQGSP